MVEKHKLSVPLKTPKKYVLFRSFHLCYAQCIKHK